MRNNSKRIKADAMGLVSAFKAKIIRANNRIKESDFDKLKLDMEELSDRIDVSMRKLPSGQAWIKIDSAEWSFPIRIECVLVK